MHFDRRLERNAVIRWLLAGLLGLLITVVVITRYRFATLIARHVDDIRSEGDQNSDVDTADELDELPAPVRRYVDYAIDDHQSSIQTVRIEQRGRFRLGGSDSSWYPLRATQHVSTNPPGFVWDATITLAHLLPIRIVDLYSHGDGLLEARLFSTVPVASAGPDPRMNQAELGRYLAEAVWFPTALLPTRGVEWTEIDDRSAEATLEANGVSTSMVFHFDERGRVDRVTTDRYNQDEDAYVPWTGYFENYERRGGLAVPTTGEVEWNYPEEDVRYGRFFLTDIQYEMASDGTT